jgi:hypothetical protein
MKRSIWLRVLRLGVVPVTLILGVIAAVLQSVFETLGGATWNWWTLAGNLVVTVFLAAVVSIVVKFIEADEKRRNNEMTSRRMLLQAVPVLHTGVTGALDRQIMGHAGGSEEDRLRREAAQRKAEDALLASIKESTEFNESLDLFTGDGSAGFPRMDAWAYVRQYAMMGKRGRRLAAVAYSIDDLKAIANTSSGEIAVAAQDVRLRAFEIADHGFWIDSKMTELGYSSIGSLAESLHQASRRDLDQMGAQIAELQAMVSGDTLNEDFSTQLADDPRAAGLKSVVQLLASERMLLDIWAGAVANLIKVARQVENDIR